MELIQPSTFLLIIFPYLNSGW